MKRARRVPSGQQSRPRDQLTAGSRRLAAAWLIPLVAAAACGKSVRTAELVPHPVQRPPGVLVESPPPPAKIEEIPEDPERGCVWVDGQWEWQGRRWEWVPGAWMVPQPDCNYAEPLIVYEAGILFYAGTWYHEGTDAVCEKPMPCPVPAHSRAR